MNATPIVTWGLVSTNAIVWLATAAAGGTENPEVLVDFGAMFGPLIASGQYWRLFTAMFLHVGGPHLAFNGLGLIIFGPVVERSFGHVRFLTIYILAGLSGSVASYMFNSIAIGAGASGAIFGVLGALAAFFFAERRLFGSLALRNLAGILVLVAINLIFGLATPRIDNWAHLGGFVAGFLLGMVLAPQYMLMRTPFGQPVAVQASNSLLKRWWVVPLTLFVLLIGALLATATLPDNALTHLFAAEHSFEQRNYDDALREVSEAVRQDRMLAEAYHLRGRILADIGDEHGARTALGKAIQLGGPDTRSESVRVLLKLRSRR